MLVLSKNAKKDSHYQDYDDRIQIQYRNKEFPLDVPLSKVPPQTY